MTSDILGMDAVGVASAVQQKMVSPVEVTEAWLERLESLEPRVHAFCTPTPDLARAQAKELEARIMRGDTVGPLAGVPIGIKDLICTAGIRTVAGSVAYRDFVPDEDDVVVERVKRAGSIVFGKTNVPEFGYSGASHNAVFETTRNPWNTDMTSGGSSSGSAAAVAAGEVPFAIGSDGGGSIRAPSSLCGIYGMKPSMGRVPLYPGCRDERYPGISSWETIEHLGPMSRTVRDAALMLSVIAGPDSRDRRSIPTCDVDWTGCLNGDLKGLKVAFSPDWGYAPVEPYVRSIVESAVSTFERDLGCHVEIANPGWEDPFLPFWGVVMRDTDLKGMRRIAAQYGSQMSPHLVAALQRPWTAEELTDAAMARKALANKMWRFMENYDLLLTPTLPITAFPIFFQGPEKIDGRIVAPSQWIQFTFPMNLTGQPAASVPAGFTSQGLPVGLQIIGGHLGDELVLKASAAFERARPWAAHWPALTARGRAAA